MTTEIKPYQSLATNVIKKQMAMAHPAGPAKPSNLLSTIDNVVYQAMLNSVLAYKPADPLVLRPNPDKMLKANFTTPKDPWRNDFIRSWIKLTEIVIREYSRNPVKAIQFPVTQLILCAMNPNLGEGRIWNPIHTIFALGAPFVAGNLSIYLDQWFLGGHSNNVERQERLGTTPFHKHIGAGLTLSNFLGKGQRDKDNETNIYGEVQAYPEYKAKVTIDQLFSGKKSLESKDGATTPTFYQVDKAAIRRDIENRSYRQKLETYDYTPIDTDDDVVNREVDIGRYRTISGRHVVDLLIYDFKTNSTVAFPAAIKSFSEALAPSWQLENYIGRVDPVPAYLNTTRTINVGLEFFAASEEEFTIMWQKLNWMSSLVYPEFNDEGIRNKTPIVRIKLGDVVNNSKDIGLLSIITTLNYDYKDSSWEIDPAIGIGPRNIAVTLSFVILHETKRTEPDDKDGSKSMFIHAVSLNNDGMRGFRKLGAMEPVARDVTKTTTISVLQTIEQENSDELMADNGGVEESAPSTLPEGEV